MNARLIAKIERARARLEADPDGILAGELPQGKSGVELPPDASAKYFQFLSECDGPSCGSFDFWPVDELGSRQRQVDGLIDETIWLYIGQLVYEPLVLNRQTGDVVWFPSEGEQANLGEIDSFFEDIVFGLKYSSVIPGGENSKWFQLIEGIEEV